MTSQIKGSGKQSRVTEVWSMENKTDDALKARFLTVRKEIYNRYANKWRPSAYCIDSEYKRIQRYSVLGIGDKE